MKENAPFAYTSVQYTFPLEKIAPKATVVSIGSCFAVDVIGRLFGAGVFGRQNPNGILYHPSAISDALQRIDLGYRADDFFEYNGLWHSWKHHGSFSSESCEMILEKTETARKNFLKALKKADACFITLSSAVQYWHIPSQQFVANCHKVPGNEFERKLSSAEMCAAGIVASCRKIREINSRCKLIFTLSPVRHYPGELTLNAISKARLLNGIYHALEKFDNAAYFPAYEIQMDELRDYRYYADDMLHPAETAKKILLNRLLDSCFTPDFCAVFQEAEEKRRAAAHRQLHPEVNES